MNKITLLVIGVFVSTIMMSQRIEKLESSNSIIWFGLDFSQTKLIGTPGQFNDLEKITSYYFAEWNSLFIKESKKYNVCAAFNKTIVENNINNAMKKSIANNSSDILSLDKYAITENDVRKVVTEYSSDSDKEIGVLFIVETLDDVYGYSTVWVTFFNTTTKQVLLTKKVTGKVRGSGFRNYWMNSFYDVLRTSKNEYEKWLKEAK